VEIGKIGCFTVAVLLILNLDLTEKHALRNSEITSELTGA